MGNLIIEVILIDQAHCRHPHSIYEKHTLGRNKNMTSFTSGYSEVSEHMQLPRLLYALLLCLEAAPDFLTTF